MIEIRLTGLHHHPGEDPSFLADISVRTEAGLVARQTECFLQVSVPLLLNTVDSDHPGGLPASEASRLVGDCGVPDCCGQDFGVRHDGGDVILSWLDHGELDRQMRRAAASHPDAPTFAVEVERLVPRWEVRVPSDEYARKMLTLAARYLMGRRALGDPDPGTQEAFDRTAARRPEAARRAISEATRRGGYRFPTCDREWTRWSPERMRKELARRGVKSRDLIVRGVERSLRPTPRSTGTARRPRRRAPRTRRST